MSMISYHLIDWSDEVPPPELENQTLDGWAAFLAAGPRWCEDEDRQPPPDTGATFAARRMDRTYHEVGPGFLESLQDIHGRALPAAPDGIAWCFGDGLGWGPDDIVFSYDELVTDLDSFDQTQLNCIATWSETDVCVRFDAGPPPTLVEVRYPQKLKGPDA